MAGDPVVIAGGGPAGSVCAARLASLGRPVVVLEKDRHPRFHLGESLLPRSLAVLDAIGVLDEVRSRFIRKAGARFVDGVTGKARRYAFAEAFHAKPDHGDHAFQVPRDAFDELLFRHAGRAGAELREGWTATRVVREAGVAVAVEATGPGGEARRLPASFVVDATGRGALVARAARDVTPLPGLDRTALYMQVRGAWRDEGEREGDIQIVLFGEGDERGWFWLIPFADGRTSVGAVVSSAWLKARRQARPQALLDEAIASSPVVARMLEGSTQVLEAGASADFSFHVEGVRGDGWLVIGDAGGFIDPLFSTGVHLALCGALGAADAIHAALGAGDVSGDRFAAWERELRTGTDLFLGAVRGFYHGDLAAYLFAEPQHPFLRRAITSLLAGDVFDPEARWVAELRGRFPAQRPGPDGP